MIKKVLELMKINVLPFETKQTNKKKTLLKEMDNNAVYLRMSKTNTLL